jgi:hypothetical protein
MNHHNIIYMQFPLSHDIWSSSKLTSLYHCDLESLYRLTFNPSTIVHFLIQSLEAAEISLSSRGQILS